MKTNRIIKLHQVMMNRKNGTWMKTRTVYMKADAVAVVSWLGDINGKQATEITFTTGKKIMVSEAPEIVVKALGVDLIVADPTEGEPEEAVEFTIAVNPEELARAAYNRILKDRTKAAEAPEEPADFPNE